MSFFLNQSVLNGAARQLDLPYTPAVDPTLVSWSLVASWQSPDGVTAHPCDVRLDVTTRTPEAITTVTESADLSRAFPNVQAEAYCGEYIDPSTAVQNTMAGAWRITYGAGGEKRVVVCDLRSGRYPLGACTTVTVEAMRWDSLSMLDFPPPTLNVCAAIVPSTGSANDEPTVTIVGNVAAGAGFVRRTLIPAHARWWVPMIDGPYSINASQNFWGGSNPDLVFQAFGEQVYVSPSLQTIVPAKHRYEVGQRAYDADAQYGVPGGTIRTALDEEVIVTAFMCGVRFYLCT